MKSVIQEPEETERASLGAIYTFNEHWSLKAAATRTLRDETRGGPRLMGTFYLVWNF